MGLLTQHQILSCATFAGSHQPPIADTVGDVLHCQQAMPLASFAKVMAQQSMKEGERVKAVRQDILAGNAWLRMHIHDLCQVHHED